MGRLISYDSVRHICKDYTNIDAVGLILADREDMMPTVEAIPKADYEARLKADMVAMLTDIQLEIEELDTPNNGSAYMDCVEIIQQKINTLKGANNE